MHEHIPLGQNKKNPLLLSLDEKNKMGCRIFFSIHVFVWVHAGMQVWALSERAACLCFLYLILRIISTDHCFWNFGVQIWNRNLEDYIWWKHSVLDLVGLNGGWQHAIFWRMLRNLICVIWGVSKKWIHCWDNRK